MYKNENLKYLFSIPLHMTVSFPLLANLLNFKKTRKIDVLSKVALSVSFKILSTFRHYQLVYKCFDKATGHRNAKFS